MRFDELKSIRKERPIIAAHRGAIGVNIPCNTIESFNIALNQGADIIELDITKSIDGELFVFHPYMDFPHLGKILPMQLKHSSLIKRYTYRNIDFTKTQYKVCTFDEVLEALKGRCIINVDKFWHHPKEIVRKLNDHNMLDSVLVKSYYDAKTYTAISELCPNVPYMLMMREYIPNVEIDLKKLGINLVAEELIFKDINDELINDQRLDYLRANDIYSWCNTIVYNYRDIISGGKTDDKAVLGYQDDVWGWLIEKGFDIIQTDWVRELSLYLNKK